MGKIAYFDCFSGISGDMIVGALVDAGIDYRAFEAELSKLKLAGFQVTCRKLKKNHIAATKFDLVDNGKQTCRTIHDLNQIIDHSDFPDPLKQRARQIFSRIAEAEATIHNQPVEAVHFHEIGAVDTVVDVIGSLVALRLLDITSVRSSRINVGSGFIQSAHGKFPVPAPATVELLKGVPIYSTNVASELVTPTGAAIITTLGESFGEFPELVTETVGYGAGAKELEHPNVLRIFIGKEIANQKSPNELISVMVTNIDDMNPQLYEHIIDTLLKNGAVDVYLTNVMMKKSRPAVQLTVLAESTDEDRIIRLIFEETTTIGLRIRREQRKTLEREIIEKNTNYGKVRFKYSKIGGEVVNVAPEYDDCKRIAEQANIPLKRAYELVGKRS